MIFNRDTPLLGSNVKSKQILMDITLVEEPDIHQWEHDLRKFPPVPLSLHRG